MIYLSIDSEDNILYERLIVAVIAFLLMVGLSLVSILVHLYFRRGNMEKKFKFVATQVIKKLADLHVKSDYSVIDKVYQAYVSLGMNAAREQMIE